MNLDKFNKQYTCTDTEKVLYGRFVEVGDIALKKSNQVLQLLEQYGGKTFDNGLFRIHNRGSFYYWTKLTFEYFKKFKGSALVFGFDWVGRQFALREDDNNSIILMFDPATAEAFELEASLEDFFNIDLAEGKEDLLEEKKFRSFKRSMAADLQFDHCVGFSKPLFLGGKDEITNLENSDMEVYWELNYQIYCQTKDLPPGTSINLSIEP